MRVSKRWKKKQASRIMRQMLTVLQDPDSLCPFIFLTKKYEKFIISFRRRHNYRESLLPLSDKLQSYMEMVKQKHGKGTY